MKRKFKKLLLISLCFSVASLVMTSCGNNSEADEDSKQIAVIAKGESHAFWQSVKNGATRAAKEYNYKITFRGPQSESAKDIPSQQEMVQTALSNNVKALVLATIGEGFTDYLVQAYEKNIPVVTFDSGIWENDLKTIEKMGKNPIKSTVTTSNLLASALGAEEFFKIVKPDIIKKDGTYIIGVIQHDETKTGIERAMGFSEKFMSLCEADPETKGKVKLEKEVKPGDADNSYKAALEALYEKGAGAIFMSNEGVVKQVYDAISASGSKYNKIKFCGFDAGTKQIEWMKSTAPPLLAGSVAQDSFRIGYNAVEQAILSVENKEVTENVEIKGTWWNRDNVVEMIERNLVYEG